MSADFLVGLLGLGTPDPSDDPEGAVELVRFHGLEGLAVARSRESGRPLLPDHILDELRPAYHARGLRTTLVVESGRRARELLGRLGVESLLFKGAALVAGGLYPDPGARRMDDVDLLIRPGDVEEAVAALVEGGFRPVTPWEPEKAGWLDSATFHDTRGTSPEPVALDLHWRVAYDRLRFGGHGPSRLWEGADPDAGLPAAESHLVTVAEHLLKHLRFKVHLAAYGDLARLAGGVEDWDAVERAVATSRLERGLRALLAVLARDLAAPVPRPLADGVAGSLCRDLAPASLVGRVRPVKGRVEGILHRWRMLGSPGRVAADVADAAFPSGDWLRARYGRGGPTAWIRYLRDVLRWSSYRGRSPASPNQELFDPRGRE